MNAPITRENADQQVYAAVEPTAEQRLIARMLSFDGNFDGYPSMTCEDENLIFAAYAENHDTDGNIPAYLAMLACEHVAQKQEYANARAFFDAFNDAAWQANMCEGCNEIHAELQEEEQPLYTHDCEHCQFLGTYFFEELKSKYDLYFHEGSTPEVIARFGDEPSYNLSLDVETAAHLEARSGTKPLCVAYKRAKERGLI
jgi:hypothetical protein